jgi:DNA repair protein RadC
VTKESDPRQVSMLRPDAAAVIHLVRENLRVLRQLAERYEIAWLEAPGSTFRVRNPADVAAYLGPEMAELAQEQLRVLLLDTRNNVIGSALIYQGGLNATVIRVADCFRDAVRAGAAGILLIHNHPSKDPSPSPEDVRLTVDVAKAGELLGIELVDHLVIGGDRHVSLRQRRLYTPAGVTSTVTPE